jgi:hypothetical protein
MTRAKIRRLPVPESCRALMLKIHARPYGQVKKLERALVLANAKALAEEAAGKKGARQ